jgi:hypothetical protein
MDSMIHWFQSGCFAPGDGPVNNSTDGLFGFWPVPPNGVSGLFFAPIPQFSSNRVYDPAANCVSIWQTLLYIVDKALHFCISS